jgi:hypothetical protein
MKTPLPDLSPLNPNQIKTLCALASLCFRRIRESGGADDDDTPETFRRREQLAAVKIESLKEMHQGHYRTLKAHWLVLLGLLGSAYDLLVKTGEGQEQRELMQHQVAEAVGNLALSWVVAKGQKLDSAIDGAWTYAVKTANGKFEGRSLRDLDGYELSQLRDTLINRTSAHRGRGNPANRNKSQRQSKAPKVGQFPCEPASEPAYWVSQPPDFRR